MPAISSSLRESDLLSNTSGTTLRAGYGVFYAPIYYTANSSIVPGYTQTNVYVASNDGNVTAANTSITRFQMAFSRLQETRRDISRDRQLAYLYVPEPPVSAGRGILGGCSTGASMHFVFQVRCNVGAKGRNLLANSNRHRGRQHRCNCRHHSRYE